VGPWVSGEDFWDREAELESLIRFLDDDHDVLLIAPRRVGKTSLVRQTLLKLEERGRDYCVFADRR
jgi:AAA+ ATPase superfamily predicted ATPase